MKINVSSITVSIGRRVTPDEERALRAGKNVLNINGPYGDGHVEVLFRVPAGVEEELDSLECLEHAMSCVKGG